MKIRPCNFFLLPVCVFIFLKGSAQDAHDLLYPVRTEIISPVHKKDFNNENNCRERKQGGNGLLVNGYFLFNGSMDGNRQVDPQIAVGGGYILHGTNSGLIIYDKKGNFIKGVSQQCFNDGIDPKMFYDVHNQIFIFDLWWYYDKAKIKPVNIAVSETSDPTGAWNIYPVPAKEGVDGGGIGYSRKWVGYTFPGGENNSFVMRTAEIKSGKAAMVYHFKGHFGQAVFTQDKTDDLYFFSIEDDGFFVIRKIADDKNGNPYCTIVSKKRHQLKYIDYPPASPQKGTNQKVSSGDRNPKNIVLQGNSLWFSQAVNCEGRSAVQWHQVRLTDATILQTGLIKSDTSNYIQTTIGVNKNNDLLIGFQEVNGNQFISPRFAWRLAKDAPGMVREIVSAGEGKGATDGESWGDYSGTIMDGDNFLDIWTIQSITNAKGKGETVIVRVPFKKKRKRS